jgi:hypothetical protein
VNDQINMVHTVSAAAVPNGHQQSISHEVSPLEKEWLTGALCKSVGKAIAEIEPCGVSGVLSKTAMGAGRRNGG